MRNKDGKIVQFCAGKKLADLGQQIVDVDLTSSGPCEGKKTPGVIGVRQKREGLERNAHASDPTAESIVRRKSSAED
jgi:hypothetical protein